MSEGGLTLDQSSLAAVLDTLGRGEDAALARLFELLAIPSVSTDRAFDADCRKAAAWCVAALREIGFQAEVRPTAGKPMVLGHCHGRDRSALPSVLFYGHYDVQPPDPLEEWTNPPFSPQLMDDARYGKVIVARGATDDKGQVMTFIEACRARR